MKSIGSILGYKESHSMPRQRLDKAYWQNGYIDIVKPKTILDLQSMTGKNVLPFIINNIKDIDYFHDIPIVEEQLKKIVSGEPNDEQEEDFYYLFYYFLVFLVF